MAYSYDNLQNLKIDQVFLNFPALCSFIERPATKGASTKVYAELSRYAEYTKEGHKITINKLISPPLPRPLHKNSIWADRIMLSILLELANTPSLTKTPTTTYMKAYDLNILVGLCNKDFYFKRAEQELEKVDASNKAILDSKFFLIATNKFGSIMTAVKRCMTNRCSVVFEDVWRYSINDVLYEADEGQKIAINKIRADTLELINLREGTNLKTNTVFVSSYKKEFYTRTTTAYKEELGITDVKKWVKFLYDKSIYTRISYLQNELCLQEETVKLLTNTHLINFVRRRIQQVLEGRTYLPSMLLTVEQQKEIDIEGFEELIEECLKFGQANQDYISELI